MSLGTCDGTCENDFTVVLFLHDRRYGLGKQEVSLHIDVHGHVPVLFAEFLQGFENHESGITHENIHRLKGINHALHHGLNLGLVGYIAGKSPRRATCRSNGGSNFLGFISCAADNGHFSSLPAESEGDLFSNA